LAARSSRYEADRLSPEAFLGARTGRFAPEVGRDPGAAGRPRGVRREGGVEAATYQSICEGFREKLDTVTRIFIIEIEISTVLHSRYEY
jgi:hypothetical protein